MNSSNFAAFQICFLQLLYYKYIIRKICCILMTTSLLMLNNGESLNYFEHGQENIDKKPTLFFIHGNFSNWMWWSETINALKHADYHIIAVDLRGFGDSSYNKPCSHFGDWAGDLVDFCSIKKINKCVAIGWSFGGGVSMKFAEIAPELVTKVVLTCSVSHEGYFLVGEGGVPCRTMQQIKQHPKVKSMEQIYKTSNRQAVTALFTSVLLVRAKDYPIEKCQDMITGSLKQRNYTDLMFALANSDINLHSVKAKGLMIHGKDDNIILLDTVKTTGDYFKNVLILENHAHMIPIEAIQNYAQEVRKFAQEK